MDRSRPEEFLGVDIGEAWIGIARGSSLARIAQPLKTVPAAGAIDEIKNLAADSAAAGVVLGLPRGLGGDETAQTESVRDWARTAKSEINLPFYWQDEALTSRIAAGKLRTSKAKSQTIDDHSLAAALILQDFLDTAKEQRVAV